MLACELAAMRVALIYPPTCDPTAPYLAVPMLTGFLRSHGIEVLPIDANIEAFDDLLTDPRMAELRDRIERRFAELDGRARLDHAEQLEYAALAHVLGDAHGVVGSVDDAKRTLRSQAMFDPPAYARAVDTLDACLRVISASHYPLHLDFTAYRTPFGLMSIDEIARASGPERDPFDAWVSTTLVPRLVAARPEVIGLSVCFPGQLQPAYAFAAKIKAALPDAHVTCGGPGMTQMLLRLSGERLARALGPFDSACLFEGEHTLLELCRALDEGKPLRSVANVVVRDRLMGARWLSGHGMEDLKALPAPDFDGLPLDAYLSPVLVLPYDPTRGCYWGKCTFCHYGLAEVGTAAYRERTVAQITEHLAQLSRRHGTRHFYLSQDSVAPKTLVRIAQALVDGGLDLRWATDLKPEKYLTRERADVLKKGGAVACALGVESASPRVLELIDKGAPIEVVTQVIDNLSAAGVAAEAMCFTDFPTETRDEAIATLDYLRSHQDRIAVWIVGEFGLTHGSLVAQAPARFGISETFQVDGDELGLGLFFSAASWKSDREREDVDSRLTELSRGWALRSYPWAGAVSTAHTILFYDRFGPSVFRELAARDGSAPMRGKSVTRALRFDPRAASRSAQREAAIWSALIYDERHIRREAYERLARAVPPLRPRTVRVTFKPGAAPSVKAGRRPSHATSSAR
jgi:hypothetical protein